MRRKNTSLGEGRNTPKFEDLPANVRALLLAKLGLEMSAQKAANIHQLARMRGINVDALWRNLRLRSEQPLCTIPVAIKAPHPGHDIGNA